MDGGQPLPPWKCYICSVFVALTLKVLMAHYFSAHSKELNFFVKCGVNNCPASFRRYHSFTSMWQGITERNTRVLSAALVWLQDLPVNLGVDTDGPDLDTYESTSEGTDSDSSYGSSKQEIDYDAYDNVEIRKFVWNKLFILAYQAEATQVTRYWDLDLWYDWKIFVLLCFDLMFT